MTLNLITLQPIIALVAGILILIIPRLLNFIVAIYLIVIGITGPARPPVSFETNFSSETFHRHAENQEQVTDNGYPKRIRRYLRNRRVAADDRERDDNQ